MFIPRRKMRFSNYVLCTNTCNALSNSLHHFAPGIWLDYIHYSFSCRFTQIVWERVDNPGLLLGMPSSRALLVVLRRMSSTANPQLTAPMAKLLRSKRDVAWVLQGRWVNGYSLEGLYGRVYLSGHEKTTRKWCQRSRVELCTPE
jgi:hypothetical protein